MSHGLSPHLSHLLVSWAGLEKVGGYEALQEKYMRAVPSDAVNSTCGSPRPDSFSLLRDVTSDYPWIGTLFFNIPADIWFWCSDQVTSCS